MSEGEELGWSRRKCVSIPVFHQPHLETRVSICVAVLIKIDMPTHSSQMVQYFYLPPTLDHRK